MQGMKEYYKLFFVDGFSREERVDIFCCPRVGIYDVVSVSNPVLSKLDIRGYTSTRRTIPYELGTTPTCEAFIFSQIDIHVISVIIRFVKATIRYSLNISFIIQRLRPYESTRLLHSTCGYLNRLCRSPRRLHFLRLSSTSTPSHFAPRHP